MHVDGWLCEIKDVQIRDGLHVLGAAPEGEPLIDLVLAVLRAEQVFGGQVGGIPGLRRALGLAEGADTATTDRVEAQARRLVAARRRRGLGPRTPWPGSCEAELGQPNAAATCLACSSPAPRWSRGWPAPATRSARSCTRWTAATCRPVRPARRCAG